MLCRENLQLPGSSSERKVLLRRQDRIRKHLYDSLDELSVCDRYYRY